MTTVLMYHDVRPRPVEGFERFTVTPDVLREQLEAFLQAGYEAAPLAAAERPGSDGARAFCVTFDDALSSLAEHAVPVLADLGVPAAIFAPTAYVGGPASWLDGPASKLSLLDWTELKDLERLAIEIGGHGRSHEPLDLLDEHAAAAELQESAGTLAERLGSGARCMAYPFGEHSAAVRSLARSAGYRAAYAVGELPVGPSSDRWALPRITADAQHRGAELVALARRRAHGHGRAARMARAQVYRGLRRTLRIGPRVHGVAPMAGQR